MGERKRKKNQRVKPNSYQVKKKRVKDNIVRGYIKNESKRGEDNKGEQEEERGKKKKRKGEEGRGKSMLGRVRKEIKPGTNMRNRV